MDLKAIRKTLKQLEAPSRGGGRCPECAELKSKLLPILQGMLNYIALTEPAIDEMKEENRSTATIEMASETALAGRFNYLQRSSSELPPMLAALERSHRKARDESGKW